LGSLFLTHATAGVVPGLKQFPPDQRPPVAITFFAFRIMVGIGLFMFALVAIGLWLRFRKRLYDARWYLRSLVFAAPLGFVAVLAGWTVTEVGRQPWTVYGLLRTADSVTPSLSGGDVLTSLILYVVVYLVVFPVGLWFMGRIVSAGPVMPPEPPIEAGRPRQPVEELPATKPPTLPEGGAA
jgi:cytochrome d ubiquinol oxidase subunit I